MKSKLMLIFGNFGMIDFVMIDKETRLVTQMKPVIYVCPIVRLGVS